MSDESNVSWGTIIKGAAIAAGVVAAIAIFPPVLGAVSTFIAANPILTIGAAAVAGGVASKQWAAKENDAIGEQIDRETFAMKIDTERMNARMAARAEMMGLAGAGAGRG